MPFFRTITSFKEGNMAKQQKLELELDEFLEPSQPSPKAKGALCSDYPMQGSLLLLTAKSLMGRCFVCIV